MDYLKTIEHFLGKKIVQFFTLIVLGASCVVAVMAFIPDYVLTQSQFKEYQKDQEVKEAFYDLQLTNVKMENTRSELSYLKKLKRENTADSDDLERIDELKEEIKKLEAKIDSLQNFIKTKRKE